MLSLVSRGIVKVESAQWCGMNGRDKKVRRRFPGHKAVFDPLSYPTHPAWKSSTNDIETRTQ